MAADLTPEWAEFGLLQCSLWPSQPWDPTVIASLLVLAHRTGLPLQPEQAKDALLEWAATPGEHEEAVRRRRYPPSPPELLDLLRELDRRSRPALPPPPAPDDTEAFNGSFERWVESQPAERVERIRQVRERLRMVPPGEEHLALRRELIAAYLEGRGAAVTRSPGVADPRLTDLTRQAQEVPITAAQIAHVEAMVRDGDERLVPARYRHLLPEIRARVKPRGRRSKAS